MRRTYARVPRVGRLDYLVTLLESFRDDKLDEKRAHKAIQQQIHHFEDEKARALGRQRPQRREGSYTVHECLRLASHLGLLDRSKHLAADAARVLDTGQRRQFLLERIWQVYPGFGQLVLTARDTEHLDLPFYNWDAFRRGGGNLYRLEFDRLNFEVLRDLATQLGLVNWYPSAEDRQIVYPVACMASLDELNSLAGLPTAQETFAQRCRYQIGTGLGLLTVENDRYVPRTHVEVEAEGYLILQVGFDQLFVRDRDVPVEEFEQTLWKEYLGLSGMRVRFPVLYPDLRNLVCATLHISDKVFDRHLLSLVQEPRRLNVYPSGGILNYAANLAHLGKFLPPQTSQGNFIIYLKIERRSAP